MNDLVESLKEREDENYSGFDWLDDFAEDVFKANMEKGFWDVAFIDHDDGTTDFDPELRNFGELLMLVVSELGESIEAHRKNLMDDHLPKYEGRWVEVADAVIRLLDLAGAHGIELGTIIEEKLAYNRNRSHRHGKKY
jgi:NTP pyrophosphatase (non-canonical NTP hydrolase)